MNHWTHFSVAALASFASCLLACGVDEGPSVGGIGEVSVIDGFHAPEDLEILPSGDLLVAEYGGITGARGGTIKLLRTDGHETTLLYPMEGADPGGVTGENWGDPECGPSLGAAIAPHGVHLDLGNGPGGKDRLLVVNHAKRESIELFEVEGAEAEQPKVLWRGCVVTPDHVWLNDVAGLPDGGFVATHMTPRGTTVESLLENTDGAGLEGHVLEWNSASGWKQIPDTEGMLVNGVAVSADGKIVYANHYMGDQVVAHERETGKRLWSTPVDGPDNPSWTSDGKLLIASHREDLKAVLDCHERHDAFCGLAYGVVEIDPETGEAREIHAGEGAPFGGATVAVLQDRTLYLGCFTGERIGVVSLSD